MTDGQPINDASSLPPFSEEKVFAGKMSVGDTNPHVDSGQAVEFVPLRIVGEGGMGIVYRALQRHPERIVALKVFKGTSASHRAARRFEREIAILARLHHRSIAHLYGVGTIDLNLAGQAPFMAIEFVEGEHITTYADAHHLNTIARIHLMIQVCDAIAYAHRQGVVHRDLKPANILIDSEGVAKVLDFGLATLRETSAPMDDITEGGDVLGTFAYASPEQARGLNEKVDAQTDVYALGGILFELLTGSTPHQTVGTSWSDIVRRIDDGKTPSIQEYDRAYADDLTVIVSKAMAPEKAVRYKSVTAFVEDLRRFSAHKPILAKSPTLTYRISKFIRRNRILVAAAALLFLSLSVGILLTANEAYRANREAARANAETHIAEEQLAHSELAQGDALQLAARYEDARNAYDQAWDAADQAHISTVPVEAALWELNTKAAVPLEVLATADERATSAVYSPSRQKIVLAFATGRVEIRDFATGQTKVRFQAASPASALLLSPDGNTLAVCFDKSFQIWNLSQLERKRELQVPETGAGYLSINNSEVGALTPEGLQTFSVDSNLPDRTIKVPSGTISACLGPDLALLQDTQRNVFRCVLKTGECQELGTLPDASCVVYSSDGSCLAIQKGNECIWFDCSSRLKEMARISVLHGYILDNFVTPVCLFLHNPPKGLACLANLHGETIELPDAHGFKPWVSRNAAITQDHDNNCRFFALGQDNGHRTLSLPRESPIAQTLSPDGAIAAVALPDGGVRIFDCSSGCILRTLETGAKIARMQIFDQAQRLAVSTHEQTVDIWNLLTGQRLTQITVPDQIASLGCSESDETLVVKTTSDRAIKISHKGSVWVQEPIPTTLQVVAIAVNSQASALCVASYERAEIWTTNGQPRRIAVLASNAGFFGHVSYVGSNTLLADDRRGNILAWTAEGIPLPPIHSRDNVGSDILGSNSSLYLESDAAGVQLWDFRTHDLVRQLLPKRYDLSISSDGHRILARTAHDGVILLDLDSAARMRAATQFFSRDEKEVNASLRKRAYSLAGLQQKLMSQQIVDASESQHE
jgi:serine/threonine protein kinase/WD40 repeat protein